MNRLGQTQQVYVWANFIKETIDIKIAGVQWLKSATAQNLLGDSAMDALFANYQEEVEVHTAFEYGDDVPKKSVTPGTLLLTLDHPRPLKRRHVEDCVAADEGILQDTEEQLGTPPEKISMRELFGSSDDDHSNETIDYSQTVDSDQHKKNEETSTLLDFLGIDQSGKVDNILATPNKPASNQDKQPSFGDLNLKLGLDLQDDVVDKENDTKLKPPNDDTTGKMGDSSEVAEKEEEEDDDDTVYRGKYGEDDFEKTGVCFVNNSK